MSILSFVLEILAFAVIICMTVNEEKLIRFEKKLKRAVKIFFRKRHRVQRVRVSCRNFDIAA